jgi:hypothetical protein
LFGTHQVVFQSLDKSGEHAASVATSGVAHSTRPP